MVYFLVMTVLLGWGAAVVFPVVNNIIIKTIGYMSLPSLESLPDFNFSFNEQLISHLGFFLVIAVLILVRDMKMQKKLIGNSQNRSVKLEK